MAPKSQFKVNTLSEIWIEAVSYNCQVIVAKPNELQFDIDSTEAYSRWEWFYNMDLCPRFGDIELPAEIWKSKSNNQHIVVTLPVELSVPERIALQTQGGSDSTREFCALCCHWDGSPHPILLFKPYLKLLS